MPIISIKFIQDVVATPEQKKELVTRMTDTFVSVLGDVVRPFTYCLVEEVPQGQWGIAGVPMPDLPFLTGETYAGICKQSSDHMKAVIAAMTPASDDKPSVK